MSRTTLRPFLGRFAALSAGAALALTGVTGLVSPASADPSPSGTAAVSWIKTQQTGGVFGDNCAFYCGPSIDAAQSALALGDPSLATALNATMAADPEAYTDYAYSFDGDDYAGRAAGAVAKQLVLAQQAGANATSYGPGGDNLVARLGALTGANGRIADEATVNGAPDPSSDFANTYGQAFAAQGLTAAGSPKAAAATSYLLAQQCPAGFFRQAFPAKNADTPCAANPADPGADATGFAVLALQPQLADPTVKAAVDKATAWLVSAQATNGSFKSAGADGVENSNSTGLAGRALGASCQTAAATKAAAFVRGLQVPATQTGALAADKGAIAFTAKQLADSQAAGIDPADQTSWWTASAQASGLLGWDPSAPTTVQLAGPTALVQGGKPAGVTITGVAAGERVCVSDSTGKTAALTGTGGPLSYSVTTPEKGAGEVTVTATTGPGSASATVSSIGKAKLKPKLAKRVEQGAKVKVKLKGLGAKEKVKVFVDGKRVAKGKANAKGVFKGSFRAKLSVGKHKLKVVGQYAGRKGTKTFTVTR